MKTVQVGVVGVGNIGSAHARLIAEGKVPGMALAALCDTQPQGESENGIPGYSVVQQP